MNQNTDNKEVLTIEHFMKISAEIQYQLTAIRPNPRAILAKIFAGKHVPEEYEKSLLAAVNVLLFGYEGKRRKSGPHAAIHPLRTTAIISHCMKKPQLLDLIGALLHDLDEDIISDLASQRVQEFQEIFNVAEKSLDQEHQWLLGERRNLYFKRDNQLYYQYLLPIIDFAKNQQMKDLLHVKLADRLDNTLDTHIFLPGVSKYNFYRFVFDLFFVPVFSGVKINEFHIEPSEKESVLLLSQLFKNAIFLSLLRQEGLDILDETTSKLCYGLAVASIREAQWIALVLFSRSRIDFNRQREVLMATMEYCHSGGVTKVQKEKEGGLLDGAFIQWFAEDEKRKERLRDLFIAKDQLAEVIVAFIATFACFIHDPNFYIQGIDRSGVNPISSP